MSKPHDNLDTIGKLLTGKEGRDAVHVAIVPVIAAIDLQPGQRVGLDGDKVSPSAKHVGIIDPFLKEPVKEGQCCWLFLFPLTITGLRHVWSHPSFVEN